MMTTFYVNIWIYPGKMKIAEILILNGANVNAYDVHKKTPLHFAAEQGKFEIFLHSESV